MDDKVDKSPCAELVPAALDLPWNEMDSPPAGDPVPELLDQELPDQEEPAETDDDEEEPEPSEAIPGKPLQSSCSRWLQSPPLGRSEAFLNKEYKGTLQKVDLLESGAKGKGAAIGAAIGVGVAVIGAPVVIWAAGFTGAGIAAGSIAAKMMSAAAIANGGGVAAGSLVAGLQSAGAVGLSVSVQAGLSATLGSVGAAFGSFFSSKKSK